MSNEMKIFIAAVLLVSQCITFNCQVIHPDNNDMNRNEIIDDVKVEISMAEAITADDIIEGDILIQKDILPPTINNDDGGESNNEIQAGATNIGNLWPNGYVPYVMGLGFYKSEQQKIRDGLRYIERVSCIRFKEFGVHSHDRPTDFVHVMFAGGCFSSVGKRIGGGRQTLSLGIGCLIERTIKHEFLHAIGFHHEQSRPDRDQYVDIHYDNIKEGILNHNFDKVSAINSMGVSYDKQSIMHYWRTAFAINKNKPTITSKSNYNEVLGGNVMTDKDILQLNRLYNCKGGPPPTNPPTPPPKPSTKSTTTRRPPPQPKTTTTTRRPRPPTTTTTSTTTRRPRPPTTTTTSTTTRRPRPQPATTTQLPKTIVPSKDCGDYHWSCIIYSYPGHYRCKQDDIRRKCPRGCGVCKGPENKKCMNMENVNGNSECKQRGNDGECTTTGYRKRFRMKKECTKECCKRNSLYPTYRRG